MRKVKSYEDFVNEEINLKKALVGGALAASLTACGPNDNKRSVDVEPYGTERVQPVTKTFDELPATFDMDEQLITIGMDMDITSGGDTYGRVEERTMSWGRTFELFDPSHKKIASAKQEVFSLYTDIKIKDESGKLIGSLEQEIMDSMFSIYSIYSIKDGSGRVIGKSEKLDFFTTEIDIVDNSGNSLVSLDKAFMSIGDSWTVKTNGTLDNRIVVFIPAFVSAAQADKADENSDDDK
jgi:uncharacterized protein YxjI